MFFRLSCQFPDGTERHMLLGLRVELLTYAAASTVGAARQLCEPANLRRAFGYAKPWLPVLADVVGLGLAGQVALHAALALTQHALGEEPDGANPPAEG
jgi:hypothetical protein